MYISTDEESVSVTAAAAANVGMVPGKCQLVTPSLWERSSCGKNAKQRSPLTRSKHRSTVAANTVGEVHGRTVVRFPKGIKELVDAIALNLHRRIQRSFLQLEALFLAFYRIRFRS